MTVYTIMINDEYVDNMTYLDEKAFDTYEKAVNYAYEKIKDKPILEEIYSDEEPENLTYEDWLKKELTDNGYFEGIIGIECVTVY